MAWYPLYDNEHLAFPEELREAVLDKRRKSRSKHKAHDEGEYAWAVYWCAQIGPNINRVYPFLAQRWQYRLLSNWQVEMPGIHPQPPNPDLVGGGRKFYWDSITEVLASVGLAHDDTRPSEYS